MSLSITTATPHSIATRGSPATSKAEKAACDFEAILLGSLLEKLQKTVAGTNDDDSSASGNYAAMGTQALAAAMAARGGIGIAHMILESGDKPKYPK